MTLLGTLHSDMGVTHLNAVMSSFEDPCLTKNGYKKLENMQEIIKIRPGIHLIVTITVITVIIEKPSIPVITEWCPFNCSDHSKNFQDNIFLVRNQKQHKMNLTAMHLGKYNDCSDRSLSLACVHMIVTIVHNSYHC